MESSGGRLDSFWNRNPTIFRNFRTESWLQSRYVHPIRGRGGGEPLSSRARTPLSIAPCFCRKSAGHPGRHRSLNLLYHRPPKPAHTKGCGEASDTLISSPAPFFNGGGPGLWRGHISGE